MLDPDGTFALAGGVPVTRRSRQSPLAEARGCRLVTTDGKLRDYPGRRCDVHVVTLGRG